MASSGTHLAEWAELTGDRLPESLDEDCEEFEDRH